MGKIFVLITQLKNSTDRSVKFAVKDGDCPLPELPPGKTRKIKLSKILRCCRRFENPDWTIDVLVGGVFTGMQLKPKDHVLRYVRIVFRIETNGDGLEVACIDGVLENQLSDYFLRHKYFGWMRNRVWDTRPYEQIARADSDLAKKLRDLEAPAQNLDPFADAIKRPHPSPGRKGDNDQLKNTTEKELKMPESLKVHISKGQTNVITTTAQLSPHERSESRWLSSGTVDRTAGGGTKSPDPMVKNGSDLHLGWQRLVMKDDDHHDLEPPAENLDPFAYAIKRPYPSSEKKGDNDQGKNTDAKISKNTTESESETVKETKRPKSLKENKSVNQPNVIMTTATQLPLHERSESRRLSSGTVDRTAAGVRKSPDRMVKNGSDHIDSQSQRPIMKDDHLDYDHRGNMDSFIHGLLFVFAFAMIAFGSLYIRL